MFCAVTGSGWTCSVLGSVLNRGRDMGRACGGACGGGCGGGGDGVPSLCHKPISKKRKEKYFKNGSAAGCRRCRKSRVQIM